MIDDVVEPKQTSIPPTGSVEQKQRSLKDDLEAHLRLHAMDIAPWAEMAGLNPRMTLMAKAFGDVANGEFEEGLKMVFATAIVAVL